MHKYNKCLLVCIMYLINESNLSLFFLCNKSFSVGEHFSRETFSPFVIVSLAIPVIWFIISLLFVASMNADVLLFFVFGITYVNIYQKY